VFQEVSFEGPTELRALVSPTHHLIWNKLPGNTTECYDLAAPTATARDLWGTSAGAAACVPLKAELQRRVQQLAFPAGLRDKLAFGLVSAGRPAPAPAVAQDARFGELVRYRGHDRSAASVRRGGALEVVHHLEVLAPVTGGWKPFFHLDGPPGYRNLDHIPVEGAYPIDRWRPGQTIRDRHQIPFGPATPPGVYTLYVGFFRGNDRLPVTPAGLTDGKDRLRVLDVKVE
jgi:hypothetical protein